MTAIAFVWALAVCGGCGWLRRWWLYISFDGVKQPWVRFRESIVGGARVGSGAYRGRSFFVFMRIDSHYLCVHFHLKNPHLPFLWAQKTRWVSILTVRDRSLSELHLQSLHLGLQIRFFSERGGISALTFRDGAAA